jgi:hypothetical protein
VSIRLLLEEAVTKMEMFEMDFLYISSLEATSQYVFKIEEKFK